MKVERIYSEEISFMEIYKNIINQKIDSILKEYNSKKSNLIAPKDTKMGRAKS